jgi:hypothetical protein
VEAAAARDVVDARIRTGEERQRHEKHDQCDEDQSEHDLMVPEMSISTSRGNQQIDQWI